MWPEISLLHYDPRNPGSSRRIKPEVWQRFHEKITTLHNEGCTKAEIRTNIENDPEAILLSFHPSIGQLVRKMGKWELSAHRRPVTIFTGQVATPIANTVSEQANTKLPKVLTDQNLIIDHGQASNHSLDMIPSLQDGYKDKGIVTNNDYGMARGSSSLSAATMHSNRHGGEIGDRQTLKLKPTEVLPNDGILQHDSATASDPFTPWLWPQDLDMLTAVHCRELHDTAVFLAAAGISEDAFDLFHLEYRYWQGRARLLATEGALCGMTTAAINCARMCLSCSAHQLRLAQQILGEVLERLMVSGLSHGLDSSLLHLYLSIVLKRSDPQASRRHQDDALRWKVFLDETPFKIISADIQDRENIFMTAALKATLKTTSVNAGLLDSYNIFEFPPWLPTYWTHLMTNCATLAGAVEKLLLWCRDLITRNRRPLDKAALLLPRTGNYEAEVMAPWRFYCYCASVLLLRSPTVQGEQHAFLAFSCQLDCGPHFLDGVLALSLISNHFLELKPRMTLFGPRWGLSSTWLGGIDVILHTPGKLEAISKAYVRMLETAFEEIAENRPRSMSTSAATKPSLKDYIKRAMVSERAGLSISSTVPFQPASAESHHPSLQPAGRKDSQASAVSSFRSSINTIRSSMSFDTKEMVGLKIYLRRPLSRLSIRSRDSEHSKAPATQSRDEDSFEIVTGMPSMDLAQSFHEHRDTNMIERIDEEGSDVEMQDG